MDETLAPLLVRDSAGTPAALLLCNEKSRAKSLERGELWYVTAAGRVLPAWGGSVVTSVAQPVERGGARWFEVTAQTELPAGAPARAARGGDGPTRSAEAVVAEQEHGADAPDTTAVRLAVLEALIRERRATMPEGSYTTHLFAKGRDKIRKKLGEEAIELLLAGDDREVVSEAADLIYHLLVLLVERDLSFELVLEELAARH